MSCDQLRDYLINNTDANECEVIEYIHDYIDELDNVIISQLQKIEKDYYTIVKGFKKTPKEMLGLLDTSFNGICIPYEQLKSYKRFDKVMIQKNCYEIYIDPNGDIIVWNCQKQMILPFESNDHVIEWFDRFVLFGASFLKVQSLVCKTWPNRFFGVAYRDTEISKILFTGEIYYFSEVKNKYRNNVVIQFYIYYFNADSITLRVLYEGVSRSREEEIDYIVKQISQELNPQHSYNQIVFNVANMSGGEFIDNGDEIFFNVYKPLIELLMDV